MQVVIDVTHAARFNIPVEMHDIVDGLYTNFRSLETALFGNCAGNFVGNGRIFKNFAAVCQVIGGSLAFAIRAGRSVYRNWGNYGGLRLTGSGRRGIAPIV